MAFGCLICSLYFEEGNEERKKVKRETEVNKRRKKTVDLLSLIRLPLIYFMRPQPSLALRSGFCIFNCLQKMYSDM